MKTKPMKIVIRLSCLLSAALGVLCCGNKADAQGASTLFISYEAESGKLGGGATIVALTLRPPPNSPAHNWKRPDMPM
jgi:hypothetical protein